MIFGLDWLTVSVAGTVAWSLWKKSDKLYGVLTPERDEAYQNLMRHATDPVKLNEVADLYEKNGLPTHGSLLRKRAAWHGRTPERKAEHEEIFRNAMASQDVNEAPALLKIATIFEGMTASHKATAIRQHVDELKKAAEEKVIAERVTAELEAREAAQKAVKEAEEKKASETAVAGKKGGKVRVAKAEENGTAAAEHVAAVQEAAEEENASAAKQVQS